MHIAKVDSSKKYNIVIGSGLLDEVGEMISSIKLGKSVCIVTDDIVDGLYSETVIGSLVKKGISCCKFVIKNGESSKNAENFISLLNFLAENKLTKTDSVVALGGGVVGDLTGFAAACYNRGIGFVQIPTTLLSMVDSSVGGKTAIDLDAGKNLAGTFYQPDLVICDVDTLKTLPDEIFSDGCAEVIKYSVIADETLYFKLRCGIKEDIEDIIYNCVSIKADIVNKDEFDNGIRRTLNFGHTVGHAIEALSNYTVAHGKAVAIGMCIVVRACEKLSICNDVTRDLIIELIEKYSLPTSTDFSAEDLTAIALSDKKRSGDTIAVIVPLSVGKCDIKKIKTNELLDFIKLGL